MLSLLLRLLVVGLLFSGSIPSSEERVPTSRSFDEAPAHVLPAGKQPDQAVELKLQAVVWRRVPNLYASALQPPLVQPTLACARARMRPYTSRIHLRRRRVPRMRDDLGEH